MIRYYYNEETTGISTIQTASAVVDKKILVVKKHKNLRNENVLYTREVLADFENYNNPKHEVPNSMKFLELLQEADLFFDKIILSIK